MYSSIAPINSGTLVNTPRRMRSVVMPRKNRSSSKWQPDSIPLHKEPAMQKITPFLWFDGRAEEAARFYVSIFRNSKIVSIARYPEAGNVVHGQPAGTVMTVAFELDGQSFTALNGGPVFTFNEAISFVVDCADQEEVDYYWRKLGENGDAQAQQCGWLKDRYGLSWQIVPRVLIELMSDPDPAKTGRVMEAMLQMKKIDIAGLRRAYQQEGATP